MENKVLERLKQEYNETLNRMQDLGDILAHCAEMGTNHCGQDASKDEELHDCIAEGYKNYCRSAFEDFLARKISWWEFKRKMSMPDIVEWAKACGQDAEEEVSMSLRELLGMEVVGIGKGKCEGCPAEHYHAGCCKVELVGGDYICLAKPEER